MYCDCLDHFLFSQHNSVEKDYLPDRIVLPCIFAVYLSPKFHATFEKIKSETIKTLLPNVKFFPNSFISSN